MPNGLGQRFDRTVVVDASQRSDRITRDGGIRVVDGVDEPVNCAGFTKPLQGSGRGLTYLTLFIAQRTCQAVHDLR